MISIGKSPSIVIQTVSLAVSHYLTGPIGNDFVAIFRVKVMQRRAVVEKIREQKERIDEED